ncbi:proline-rich receptor-like protein kinase PERK1 [Magnolia sinica]|uniref:proline-rich receptor-like protein kinase PERK1 n=1 Tax=Magnolia sinica TaxID=86752 RepID=UPI002658266A|nr:proline-rich receptor-like protein kinase PERK1 [Magnolia sinica]
MGNCFCLKARTPEDRSRISNVWRDGVLDPKSSLHHGESAPQDTNLLPDPALLSTVSSLSSNSIFTYEEIKRATDDFSDSNFLGKGGYGSVHKGVLKHGKKVAIKRLEFGGRQGDREFQAEVEIITRVHHKHLVSLVGYCIGGSERMLVYDFVANNSLNFHLHGEGRPTMKWPIRFKIALGSAKGLAYLHTDCDPRIIHRDIKSANILLDQNWEAKIADFGLAKIFPHDETHIEVSRVAGTFGYIPPEYGANGQLTAKSDVFSFGVILLELITGFLPCFKLQGSRATNLVDWVKPHLVDGDYKKFIDPYLVGFDGDEMIRLIKCAAACVHHDPQSRPTMSQVVLVLDGHKPVDILEEDVAAADDIQRSLTMNPAILYKGTKTKEEDSGSTATKTLNPSTSGRPTPGRHEMGATSFSFPYGFKVLYRKKAVIFLHVPVTLESGNFNWILLMIIRVFSIPLSVVLFFDDPNGNKVEEEVEEIKE